MMITPDQLRQLLRHKLQAEDRLRAAMSANSPEEMEARVELDLTLIECRRRLRQIREAIRLYEGS
jgi:hypothetical protein